MDYLTWWRDLTEAQAQILSALLTGFGLFIGAMFGIGAIGDQVKKSKKEIAEEAERHMKALREEIAAIDAKAQAGLEVANRGQDEIAAEEHSEQQPDPSTTGQPDFRDQAVALVREAQDFIQQKANADPDGRYQRTYDSIPDSYFDILAEALRDRGRMTPDQAAHARTIANIWKGYQRGRASKKPVPQSVVQQLKQAVAELRGR